MAHLPARLGHVAHVLPPAADSACQAGAKVGAMLGMLLAPTVINPPIVPTNTTLPAPALASGVPIGLTADFGGWPGGGRSVSENGSDVGIGTPATDPAAHDASAPSPTGSVVLFFPVEQPKPEPTPEAVLRPYVVPHAPHGPSGPPRTEVPTHPLRVQDLPEPASLTVLGSAVAALAALRRRRASCEDGAPRV
ncbi:hypothetical protein [Rhodopila sp.]|uniref:hypothetical protein n=1 Tax=Rhodopila sp. TaxID=2480087 RepID=UPI002B69812A|nr:hypothetical protein [Rhodopila sp.]HVZ07294.1 hypothetical protein [Rhodopila sp.]